MYNMDETRMRVEQEIAEKKILVETLLAESEMLDDDGYPTDDALEVIKNWHWDDKRGWFKFIESVWWMRSWGWKESLESDEWRKEEKVYRYNISTGGWSGNESVIYAMQENRWLWGMTWVQSRRGGHYIFEVDLETEQIEEQKKLVLND